MIEKFWHNDDIHVPHLIRIAISHYQFETIHPFLDGNGRIGRLLITLYLVSKGILKKPTLYLSAYLEKRKGAYHDALTGVRESNDLGRWIRFLLTGILETAIRGKDTFQQILCLRREAEQVTLGLGKKAENARRLLNHLYRDPIITANEVAGMLDTTHQTARSIVKDFERLNILGKTIKINRSQAYVFKRYLSLFTE